MAEVNAPQPMAPCRPGSPEENAKTKKTLCVPGNPKKSLRPDQSKESKFKPAESDRFQIGPRTIRATTALTAIVAASVSRQIGEKRARKQTTSPLRSRVSGARLSASRGTRDVLQSSRVVR